MIKYTFSDDRGEKLEHYGVKGMKWHQHLFGVLQQLTDLDTPGASRFQTFVKSMLSKGFKAAANSDVAYRGQKAVKRLFQDWKTAGDVMRYQDSLSESEKNAIREKRNAENRARKEEKRQRAKANGDPLWFLAGG